MFGSMVSEEKDLNGKVYDIKWNLRDGKNSAGLWPGELKQVYSFSSDDPLLKKTY
jgi:hypothetical protein